jgi:alpha-tubulin suppressor-like RCC1 family protein
VRRGPRAAAWSVVAGGAVGIAACHLAIGLEKGELDPSFGGGTSAASGAAKSSASSGSTGGGSSAGGGSAASSGVGGGGGSGGGQVIPNPCVTTLSVGVSTSGMAGGDHTCALGVDGGVYCWGANGLAQTGQQQAQTIVKVPAKVKLSVKATSIGAGGTHTCATSNNVVYCWGSGANGQMDSGKFDVGPFNPALAANVSATKDVASVRSGWGFSCARKMDNTLWCWGDNTYFQSGTGLTGGAVGTATQVAVNQAYASLSLGYNHACAVAANTAYCWGSGGSGQLGQTTNVNSATPKSVNLASVASVSAGGAHTCAVTSGGALWCWGGNSLGQTGQDPNGAAGVMVKLPMQVTALGTSVKAVATGYAHTCVVKTDNSLWCFGDNGKSQLGSGNTGGYSYLPKQVVGFTAGSALSVAAGRGHTCAIKENGSATAGSVWCWGEAAIGNLGVVGAVDTNTPKQVDFFCK